MASNSIDYPLSRDYKASARLNLQHFVHVRDIGYVLHPSIPLDSTSIKIADVGTGTGIWLVDLHNQLPKSAVLDGFDVSTTQFPAKEWLPPNVTLRFLDMYQDIPEQLHGTYDIVHLRYFCCVVRDNDPSRIIDNAYKLLKPRGYLQWSEQDYNQQSIITANTSISAKYFRAMKEEVEDQSKSSKTRFIWLDRLVQTLQSQGFVDVVLHRQAEQPQYYSVWYQTHMMVAEEMSFSVHGGEKIREHLITTHSKTPEGVFWHRGHLTFVGRKADSK